MLRSTFGAPARLSQKPILWLVLQYEKLLPACLFVRPPHSAYLLWSSSHGRAARIALGRNSFGGSCVISVWSVMGRQTSTITPTTRTRPAQMHPCFRRAAMALQLLSTKTVSLLVHFTRHMFVLALPCSLLTDPVSLLTLELLSCRRQSIGKADWVKQRLL